MIFGNCSSPFAVPVDATGFDTTQVVFSNVPVDCALGTPLGGPDSTLSVSGPSSPTGTPFAGSLSFSATGFTINCYDVNAFASSSCTQATALDTHRVQFVPCGKPAGASQVIVSSDLSLPGGRLQVVVNGSSAAYPRPGRSLQMAEAKPGINRIEATVVEGDRAGTWRVELPAGGLKAGSLRVLAGDVVLMTETAALIRLKGAPGERVVITFERE